MTNRQYRSRVSMPGRHGGPGAAVVFVAGISAISGAIVGVAMAGYFPAAIGIFVFSLLAVWAGWLARGLSS